MIFGFPIFAAVAHFESTHSFGRRLKKILLDILLNYCNLTSYYFPPFSFELLCVLFCFVILFHNSMSLMLCFFSVFFSFLLFNAGSLPSLSHQSGTTPSIGSQVRSSVGANPCSSCCVLVLFLLCLVEVLLATYRLRF